MLSQLGACVDELLALDATGEDSASLLRSLPMIEAQLSRLRHAQLVRAAELTERKVPAELGFRGVSQFLQASLRCAAPAAKELAAAMTWFSPRHALTGEPLQPLLPEAARAMAEGQISPTHAKVIAEALDGLPVGVRALRGGEVETTLVELARTRDPRSVAILAERIAAQLDPDGPAPAEADRRDRSRRRLHLNRLGDSGGELTGLLTPACRAIWETVLTPLAVKPCGDALGEDPRMPAQRMHDAFEQAGKLLLASGELPDSAGAPTTLVLTMTVDQLEERAGAATVHHGGALSIDEALRLAAEAKMLPVVLSGTGGIMSYGRGRRLASPAQRQALFARDRGCTFPDCSKPAARSEIHHITDWAKGGETSIDSMTVTCGYHNSEAPRQGWKALMIKGIPYWQPPGWRDPDRKPIRNYLHFPELLLVANPERAVADLQEPDRDGGSLPRGHPSGSPPPRT